MTATTTERKRPGPKPQYQERRPLLLCEHLAQVVDEEAERLGVSWQAAARQLLRRAAPGACPEGAHPKP